KALALGLVVFAVLAVGMLAGVGIQAFHGYTDFELPLYLQGLFLEVGVPFLLIAVLALFAQVAINQKYLGFLALVLYFVAAPVLALARLRHVARRPLDPPPRAPPPALRRRGAGSGPPTAAAQAGRRAGRPRVRLGPRPGRGRPGRRGRVAPSALRPHDRARLPG